jgi:hypothetical protein
MGRSNTEDPKLREVKAVLQRLQRLSAEPDPVDLQSASGHSPRHVRYLVTAASVIMLAAVVILAATYGYKGRTVTTASLRSAPVAATPKAASISEPVSVPANPVVPRDDRLIMLPDSKPAATLLRTKPELEVALGHMAGGRVLTGREQLFALALEGSADVAWALARSYDPNFLGTITAADAQPDIEEATRWYRTWYALAVKEGLVADSVPLERIIGSMR